MRKRLSDQERAVIATVWAGRADTERTTAEMFRVVADALAFVGAEEDLVERARHAIDDELVHARRCWELACSYAERELPQPHAGAPDLPRYDGASDELKRTLLVVAQCCLNETTAGVFLERCLRDATEPAVRTVLRDLVADEMAHARIGWGHLASPRVSPELRQSIAAWLPQMLARNVRLWRRDVIVAPTPTLASHGLPTRATIEDVVETAFDELIAPAFEHVGIVIKR